MHLHIKMCKNKKYMFIKKIEDRTQILDTVNTTEISLWLLLQILLF